MENNETWRERFALLWGIAPHDSLKGKKGAEVIAFFESELLTLADKIGAEKKNFIENGYDQGWDSGLDSAISIIKEMAK